MRFVHTADWHLGRSFHGYSLIEEQRHLLQELYKFLSSHKVDAVFIAGDIFDRSIPPLEALSVLDDFISRTILDLKIPILMIPGNHDSLLRLTFASRLLERESLYIASSVRDLYQPMEIKGVKIHCLPFCESGHYNAPWIEQGEDIFYSSLLRRIPFSSRVPRVLLAHLYVNKGLSSDSERGGLGAISSSVFHPFHYTALGHLHRHQIWDKKVVYSGSIMKYSYSELSQEKGFCYGELNNGKLNVDFIPLKPKREVRECHGFLDDLLKIAKSEDFLFIQLEDEGVVYDAFSRLKERFPYLLQIMRKEVKDNFTISNEANRIKTESFQGERLFEEFCNFVAEKSLNEKEKSLLKKIVRDFEKEETCVSQS